MKHPCLNPEAPITAWKQIIVQQDPDHVALDLNFLEVGFGNLSAGHGFGTLKTSDSRIGIGLWHFDPLIKSNVLMSWIGSEFRIP